MAVIRAATTRPSPFVTVMAQISIALGAIGTAYGLLQAATIALFIGHEPLKGALDEIRTTRLPALAEWVLSHLPATGWIFVLLSGAFLVASIGLLKRREWGRQAFIAFMVAGAAVNFLAVWLLASVFDWVQSLPMVAESAPMQAELAQLRILSLATLTGSAVVFAALHGGIVYQLCTPAVRAEFRR